MIIGNGLLATAVGNIFVKHPDVIIFASGVSNSKETDDAAFFRERELLASAVQRKKILVYFSTCSVYDTELINSPYVKHKLDMEAIVQSSSNYLIFRLPQVVGKTDNPNTLTNYFHKKIANDSPFQIWKFARRNLIDVDDVAKFVDFFLNNSSFKNKIINIAAPFSISICELIEIFEQILSKKAKCEMINAGKSYDIDVELVAKISTHCNVNFESNYIERVLEKYYGKKANI